MRSLAAVALVLASSAAASAQGRTDIIALGNGDRISGEIRSLDRGRLEVKTDDAGTIEFEWEKVSTVTASRRFEVATSDGRRFVGSLGAPASRQLAIAGLDGSVITPPMLEVTSIAPTPKASSACAGRTTPPSARKPTWMPVRSTARASAPGAGRGSRWTPP